MAKIKVALVYGGLSREEEISRNSAGCIKSTLSTDKYEVYCVSIDSSGWYYESDGGKVTINKTNFSFETVHGTIIPDIAYIIIHGAPGENGLLQGYFDLIDLPYTTCNAFTSALTFNKAATKYYLTQHGIKTAKSVLLRKNSKVILDKLVEQLGLPLFIKPNNGGSSFGASKVKSSAELKAAIDLAFAEDNEVLVESFIEASELTCGVMKVCGQDIVFAPTEIVPKKELSKEFFDYEAKYKGFADEITPARISHQLTTEIQQLSSKIYDILDCNGVVRIDYLYADNTLYFMEINTVPGMSQQSIIPQQARYYGISIEQINDLLIEDALNRKGKSV